MKGLLMDRSAATAPAGSSKQGVSPVPSGSEATGRMLSFLSQSHLKQQLECQVRYFISGRLLNCTVGRESLFEGENLKLPADYQQTPRNSLAFKATLSLVLLWLKAHGLVHTAGLLCPEASLRNTDILSQEECQAVLHLPKALLSNSASSNVPSELQLNLLDRLIAAASSLPTCQNSGSKRNCDSVCENGNIPTNEGEGEHLDRSDIEKGFSCSKVQSEHVRVHRERATRAQGRSCPPKCFNMQMCESQCSKLPESPKSCCPRKGSTECNKWNEMASNQALLMEAHLRGLELCESSQRLFGARADTRQMIDQRLASLESEHKSRIWQLQKAVEQAAGAQKAHEGMSMFEVQATVDAMRHRIEIQSMRQKEEEAKIAEREKYLLERERRLAHREVQLAKETARKHVDHITTEQSEVCKLLTQENANFRSQLLDTKKKLEALEAELHRQKLECVTDMKSELVADPRKSEAVGASSNAQLVSTSLVPHLGGKCQDQGPVQLKQDYDIQVARLVDELQRSNDQIRSKDAEFKLLVVELESARRESAEAQKRLKKLQKRYEVARAACVQQKKLASSISLSLNSFDLAVGSATGSAGQKLTDLPLKQNDVNGFIKPTDDSTTPAEVCVPANGVSCWNDSAGVVSEPTTDNIHRRTLKPMSYDVDGPVMLSHMCRAAMDVAMPSPATLQNCTVHASESHSCHSCFPRKLIRPEINSGTYGITNRSSEGMRCAASLSSSCQQLCNAAAQPVGCSRADAGNEILAESVFSTTNGLTKDEQFLRANNSSKQEVPSYLSSAAVDDKKCRAEVSPTEEVSKFRRPAPACFSDDCNKVPTQREITWDASDKKSTPQGISERLLETGIKQFGENDDAKSRAISEKNPSITVCGSPLCIPWCDTQRNSPSEIGALLSGEESGSPSSMRQDNLPREPIAQLTSSGNCEELVSKSQTNQQDFQIRCSLPDKISGEVSLNNEQPSTATNKPPVEEGQSVQFCTGDAKRDSLSGMAERATELRDADFSTRMKLEEQIESVRCLEDRESGKEASAPSCPPTPTEPVLHDTPVRPSASVVEQRNEVSTVERVQSPWAEASIESSLPESPKGLSNFPSLSCHVAATVEGIPAPSSTNVDFRGSWKALSKERLFSRDSAVSSSPSENDWLACVSPTDPNVNDRIASYHPVR
ncbi:hypothetical protein, conserved [Eimeria tenella]|uniref:Uncharacterized protein n=1 Tax=Eimeria tenella TaxID=5802 RepID=U6KMG8_EIMTE|nr:hypothetical protein, conserved [Eimeria tenella]CDJ37462.1 hypothetical protein, conserved [Eimeria tenella]|eukprot:XP_013228300.1 hypothetical protein, conserved [Eimeria tenella]